MSGKPILLCGLMLASGLAGPAHAPAAPLVSTPQECAVYAAALANDPAGEGLYTMMQAGDVAYDIRCDWAALGVTAPKLIGLPSETCNAAMAAGRKDADAVCGLPAWTVTLARPTFSAGGARASLEVTRTHHDPGGWYDVRSESCELAKTAGKWRVTGCRAERMT